MIFLTIIAVIVIFSVIVLVHEYGHFIMARRAGIKVLEFGIGFPPRLFSKKIGETEYTVNAVPFGGFVKLYGEDSSNPAALKSKRSFASQSTWVRTKVIVAGVVMNFLLAVFLLTVGFTFGIEPLLITQEDIFSHIKQGIVHTDTGVYIDKVDESIKGVKSGDKVLAINGVAIEDISQIAPLQDGGAVNDIDLTILSPKSGETSTVHLPVLDKKSLGVKLKPLTLFPRLRILEVRPQSASALAGILPGDLILSINGQEIFSTEDYKRVMSEEIGNAMQLQILRNGENLGIKFSALNLSQVVVADVFPDSVAKSVGILSGDIITAIDQIKITDPAQLSQLIGERTGKDVVYSIKRGEESLTIKAQTGDGKKLGIALSLVDSYKNNDLSFYRTSQTTSILKVDDIKYPVHLAFTKAVSESIRLTGLTVKAFGRTFSSLVLHFEVPADVGGPVQIAYYTHTFIQEGIFALLRFMALLSLSLAVINILPIPALDGGRFLFILIEVIIGKRVNARFEGLMHSIGFIFLI